MQLNFNNNEKFFNTYRLNFFLSAANAQEQTIIDTIYIRTNVEDLSAKFHSTYQNQYKIGFFSKCYGNFMAIKEKMCLSIINHQKKNGINEWSIFIKDEKEFLIYKNYFTLEQFTKKLKEQDFFLPIFHDKVQLILLYGSKCSSKVELYPVKIGTNIAS